MTFEWTVFFGDAADAEARVYVLAAPTGTATAAELEGFKITGRVEGPKCRYSHTLPARIPVRHRGVRAIGDKSELVGEAIVPDPNFWTPELPFLYRATVEVRRGDEIVASYEQDFGIRPLGVRGKRLIFGGKTWVPRAVRREAVVGDAPLELWRETATVMVVDDPSDELCREASEVGVILFVRLAESAATRDRIHRLGLYPAVALIVSEPFVFASLQLQVPNLRDLARNLLFADTDTGEEGLRIGSRTPQACVFYRARESAERVAEFVMYHNRPMLVQKNTGKRTLVEAREACDALQADLAGKCDPAGYIV